MLSLVTLHGLLLLVACTPLLMACHRVADAIHDEDIARALVPWTLMHYQCAQIYRQIHVGRRTCTHVHRYMDTNTYTHAHIHADADTNTRICTSTFRQCAHFTPESLRQWLCARDHDGRTAVEVLSPSPARFIVCSRPHPMVNASPSDRASAGTGVDGQSATGGTLVQRCAPSHPTRRGHTHSGISPRSHLSQPAQAFDDHSRDRHL